MTETTSPAQRAALARIAHHEALSRMAAAVAQAENTHRTFDECLATRTQLPALQEDVHATGRHLLACAPQEPTEWWPGGWLPTDRIDIRPQRTAYAAQTMWGQGRWTPYDSTLGGLDEPLDAITWDERERAGLGGAAVMTADEAAQWCDITTSTWRSYVARGQAPAPVPFRPNARWTVQDVVMWRGNRPGQGRRA